MSAPVLTATARVTLQQLASAVMPAGRRIPAGGAPAIERLERALSDQPRPWRWALEGLVRAFDLEARIRARKPFARLGPAAQQRLLEAIGAGLPLERALLRALSLPLKAARYDDPEVFARLGLRYQCDPITQGPPAVAQPRATDANSLARGEELEAEVVVIGSGAGGAVVAAELAQAGVAVVMLEEGGNFERQHFNGRPWQMQRLLYRDPLRTVAFGNGAIPVLMGRCVGGSTTVNAGTCYRLADRVLRRWREELGLSDLTADELAPHFERVERVIETQRAEMRLVGPIAEIVARGCRALGLTEHGPVIRNAPDCDAQGLCCFGCPTDAKRSTNVSFVPLALRHGAQIFYNARAERIIVRGDRAVGVDARSARGRRLVIHSQAVVLAAGAVMSPLLLLRQRLANSSRQLGRNLSLHPAAAAMALFDEKVGGPTSIPQGYAVEDLLDQGLLIEGGFLPLTIGAALLAIDGPRHTALIEAFDRLTSVGFLIEDSSRGRVRAGPRGHPLITYRMNARDAALFKRGLDLLVKLYRAAGATAIFPPVAGFRELRSEGDAARFLAAKPAPRHFEMTSLHPLGTARMGVDPARSVIGPTHECHDLRGLFICDGSALPSAIGVNPQLTIMALASRAARFVADRAAS